MVINIQDDILRLRGMGLLELLLKDKATIFGGTILILLGIKTVLEHLGIL